MFVTVITDCYSSDDIGRQGTRYTNLLGCTPTFVPVPNNFKNFPTLEASALIVSSLDAAEGSKGLIVANVAPRGRDDNRKWENGTPFCYFKYQDTVIISSIEDNILGMVAKFKLTDTVQLFDLPTVISWAVDNGLVDARKADYIIKTQFRSYEFLPRVAAWLFSGEKVPTSTKSLTELTRQVPEQIWFFDTFGNIKTTITESEIDWKPGQLISTSFGNFTFYNRLKDLPLAKFGIYAGSTGMPGNRFIEIAKQQGNARAELQVEIGQYIFPV